MDKRFNVRGIDPAGRVVETVITASSVHEAKTKAEEAGLRFVVVQPAVTDGGAEPDV